MSKGKVQDHSNNKKSAPDHIDLSAKARQDARSKERLALEAARKKTEIVARKISERIQRTEEQTRQEIDEAIERRKKHAAALDEINRRIEQRNFWRRYDFADHPQQATG